MNPYLPAANRLHTYIVNTHWNGQAISGPDPVGKLNWRIIRFVRSYTRWLPWPNNLVYLQGQGYWIEANLFLAHLKKEDAFLEYIQKTARFMAGQQLESGVWAHAPILERRGFLSAIETIWACLGLTTAYKALENPHFLQAASNGYNGILNVIRLRPFENGDGASLNFFAHTRYRVPNITTMFLRLTARLYQLTGKTLFLTHNDQLIRFLEQSQMPNGELQYSYNSIPHFQCYQYNSFQFLDLTYYYQITQDERVRKILGKMATFLQSGVTQNGSCRYDCFTETPETNYWTAALAAALYKADQLELGAYAELSQRAYSRILSRQNKEKLSLFSR